MKKVLITGSNGLVGQNLLNIVRKDPLCEVYATSASPDKYPYPEGYRFYQADIRKQEDILALKKYGPFDVIIHGAAMTQVDPCELNQDLAWKVNVEGTRHLLELAESCSAHFIYVSTDFVFSGEDGPYAEENQPDPVNYYGETKWEGEKLVQDSKLVTSIVRTILVYGLMPSMSRSNFVLWVKESLEQGKEIRVVNDQFRMPTFVGDLAAGIVEIIHRGKSGTFHLSGSEMHSVYDFAKQVARFFKLDEGLIRPILSEELNQPGKRPPSTGFNLNKARTELDFEPISFTKGLEVVRNLLSIKN